MGQPATARDDEAGAGELAREGAWLSRSVFGVEAPPGIPELYARAHRALLGDAHAAAQAPLAEAVRHAVSARLDVEALELALRLRRRSNLLTQKLHLLSYLLETHKDASSRFVNQSRYRVGAWLVLLFHGVRGIVKYGRGRLLMRRLGIRA
jgi:hypothetical protein